MTPQGPSHRGASLDALARRIDAVLPQTQCGRCGYDGCAPYARAVAGGEAHNRCPPGGEIGVERIARIVGRAPLPLDPECGAAGPFAIAAIDESWCIGCTLCLQACPVDAIAGAPKRMHAVLREACTGCELCLPPCPVDCIRMMPAGRDWTSVDAAAARVRYDARNARREVPPASSSPRVQDSSPAQHGHTPTLTREQRADAVADALARARARRNASANARPVLVTDE